MAHSDIVILGLSVMVLVTLLFSSGSSAEAQAVSSAEKLRALNQMAKRTDSASSQAFASGVSAALKDDDAQVRLTAVHAVAARMGAHRYRATPDVVARHDFDGEIRETLRAVLAQAAIRDSDERVRRGALVALGNIDARPGDATNGIELSQSTVVTMVQAYQRDSSVLVKMEIVKAMALASKRPPAAVPIISDALEQSSPDLLVYALMGASALRIPRGLERAAVELGNQDRRVRLAAAGALSAYGAAAAQYGARVAKALASEDDETVRSTLEALQLQLRTFDR